jgi:hypothetical protein
MPVRNGCFFAPLHLSLEAVCGESNTKIFGHNGMILFMKKYKITRIEKPCRVVALKVFEEIEHPSLMCAKSIVRYDRERM